MAANPSTETETAAPRPADYPGPSDAGPRAASASDSYPDADRDEYDDYEDREDDHRSGPSISGRMFRLLGGLFSVHAEIAKQELGRDQSRILTGIILLVVGLSCISMVVLLLQGVLVWLIMQRGLALGYALLIVAGIDLVVAASMIALARRSFAKPMMPETRALLRRTINSVIS